MTEEPRFFQICGEAAARSVREEFSHERAIERLESFYDEAREKGAPEGLTGQDRGPGAGARPSAMPKAPSFPDGKSVSIGAGHSFCYLFERFPSFVQTFVYREAVEMVRQGMAPLLVSIRKSEDPAELAEKLEAEIFYLPSEKSLRAEVDRRRGAKELSSRVSRAIQRHRAEADSQRMFEAIWLGPRLKEAGIRHVHAHFGGMAARTAWWLRRLYGIRYSFTGHANDIFCPTDYPVANTALVRDAEFVVTETDFARRWMEEQYPFARGRIHRVFNGIAFEEFPGRQPSTPRPRILSVGRCVEKKGFGDLIEACAILRADGVPFECVIVGDGPLEAELQARIHQLALEDCVRLAGPCSQAEVRRLLGGATLFALACIAEKGGGSDNLPTVIMEAMACGLPVVSTTIAGVPEMISEGSEGFLVSPNNPPALAGALARVLADSTEAELLGRRGKEAALAKFDVVKTTAELKRLLLRFAAVQPPAAALAFDPALAFSRGRSLLVRLLHR